MKDIDKIIQQIKNNKPEDTPKWEDLKKQYVPSLHQVITDKHLLRDIKRGRYTEYSSRVTYGAQKLAARKMTQMAFSIPVQRIYKTGGDEVKEAQAFALEQIYTQAGVDAINIDRFHALFASCEIATIWYPVKKKNNLYGFDSDFRLRCITYSPMERKYSKLSEAGIYPVFDKYDDLISLGLEYQVKEDGKLVTYFQLLEADKDVLYRKKKEWEEVDDEVLAIGKIPGVYWLRTMPIWEETTSNIHEIELALSREGNILRRNSAPVLAITGNLIDNGGDPNAPREVYQLESGGEIEYVTWAQQIDAMKFYIETIKQQIEEELQLPNLSVHNSRGSGIVSGESRKTLLVDGHLKVGYESGSLIKGLERECNVIKAFLGQMNVKWKDSINDLEVEHVITPFIQDDEGAKTERISKAAGRPIVSLKTAVRELGLVGNDEVNEEVAEILEDEARSNMYNTFEPTI